MHHDAPVMVAMVTKHLECVHRDLNYMVMPKSHFDPSIPTAMFSQGLSHICREFSRIE